MADGGSDDAETCTYTTDEALSRLGFGRFQALVLGFLGTGWIAEAMEIMLLSFIGPSVKEEWGLSGGEEGLVTSVLFAGTLVGAFTGGLASDRYGRRVAFLVTALVTSISGFLCAFSPNYMSLLALRFVVGLGLGASHVLPTWFLEFVPAESRGSWMAVFTCFWTVGTVLVALLAWATLPILGWRWLLALSSLPCFIVLFFFGLIPESPRYLCSRVRLHPMQSSTLYINVLVTNFAEFPGFLLAALLVDRIGRRVSMGGMILLCCAFVAPLSTHLGEGLAVTLLFCSRACIEGSFTILHVYSREIYPTSCRNTGVGLSSSMSRIGSIVAPPVTITLLDNSLQKDAVFVIVLALFIAGTACAFFPLETKGPSDGLAHQRLLHSNFCRSCASQSPEVGGGERQRLARAGAAYGAERKSLPSTLTSSSWKRSGRNVSGSAAQMVAP
ncbi:hypothetical protein QOZ80_7BG0604820 [Eleusine coracana subsp. coracana]|nr:hypothetical protein QOZ80_7BG0604820 [Eleusine coracana subsp. coracana]